MGCGYGRVSESDVRSVSRWETRACEHVTAYLDGHPSLYAVRTIRVSESSCSTVCALSTMRSPIGKECNPSEVERSAAVLMKLPQATRSISRERRRSLTKRPDLGRCQDRSEPFCREFLPAGSASVEPSSVLPSEGKLEGGPVDLARLAAPTVNDDVARI